MLAEGMNMPYPTMVNKEGWGVYRTAPWHMHGVYRTEAEADAEAVKVGNQYTVAFGCLHAHTGDFAVMSARILPPIFGCP